MRATREIEELTERFGAQPDERGAAAADTGPVAHYLKTIRSRNAALLQDRLSQDLLRLGVQRFVVVDYKTNKLHQRGQADPLESYRPELLVGAMEHSDYPLQALLYSVALHRYLRWRLPAYQPEVHLGGVAYLFVRGMVGPSTPAVDGVPYGVFSWRPAAGAIVALEALLAGERAA